MLGQRLRRWPNIRSTSGQGLTGELNWGDGRSPQFDWCVCEMHGWNNTRKKRGKWYQPAVKRGVWYTQGGNTIWEVQLPYRCRVREMSWRCHRINYKIVTVEYLKSELKQQFKVAIQNQKAVTAHLESEQLLSFGSARQKGISSLCVYNITHNPTNTRCWSNVVLMFGQRRRRWPNIKTTLDQHVVFVGNNTLSVIIIWL